MERRREQFLAGERTDDVALFFAERGLQDPAALNGHAESVDGGYVLVVDGGRGRDLFSRAVGVDPMEFARSAMDRSGEIAPDLVGGSCPEGDAGAGHDVRFLLAFAEEEHADAGGLYAQGDVVHAYARCACGVAYSDRWVADG